MLGILGTRRLVHVLPGRCDKQMRKVRPDESRAARLARRYPQTAQMLALRAVDIDTAAAPACIPDLSVGVDNRTVEAACAAVLQQLFRPP